MKAESSVAYTVRDIAGRFLSALFYISLSAALIFAFSSARARADIEKKSRVSGAGSSPDLSLPYKQCRTYRTNGAASLAVASDNVVDSYLLLSNGNLDLIEAEQLNKIWTTDLGGRAISNTILGAKNIFVVVKNDENYFLKSVGKDAGVTIWQKKIKSAANEDESQTTLSLHEDRLILSGEDGNISAVSTADGTLIWNTNLGTSLSGIPLSVGSTFIITASDKKLTILSSDNGEKLRELEIAAPITTFASETGDKVFLGARDGSVSLVDTVGKTILWSRRVAGAQISGVVRTERGLLVASFDNFLYLLSENGGKRLWKRRLPGRIAHAPSVSDGYAVVTTLFNSSAAIVDLKNGKIVNRINLEADDYFSQSVLFGENRIIAPTAKGLTVFKTSDAGC